MQAGTLNESIVIYRQTYNKSEFGAQKTEEWSPLKKTKANVQYQKGMRVDDNDELFFSQDIIFNIRIYHDVKDLDQIEWKGRKYRILNIWPNKNLQRLEITCQLINE